MLFINIQPQVVFFAYDDCHCFPFEALFAEEGELVEDIIDKPSSSYCYAVTSMKIGMNDMDVQMIV